MDASCKETLTRRVIYYLPSPTPYGEVVKAATVARHKYRELTGDEEVWDNIPMIEAHDDEVHIWFEVPEKS